MNWGMRIVIGMAIAMSSIVAVGIYMVNQDTDTLEETDYYEKGLDYERVYEKKENLVRYQRKVTLNVVRDSLVLSFAEENNKGVVDFIRSSNRSLDRRVHFITSKSVYRLPIKDLKKGVWHIKLDWESQQRPYLQEEQLYLN